MNIFLFDLMGRWIGLLVMGIASLFGSNVDTTEVVMSNQTANRDVTIMGTTVSYDTEYVYSSNIPVNIQIVSQKGISGLVYLDESGNIKETIRDSVSEKVLYGDAEEGVYTGKMTGYGADCVGCSGVGNVACYTRSGTKHSLVNDGVYYNDEVFGNTRIIAAATSLFPCGTVIWIDRGDGNPYYGIVMDSGGAMRTAWNERGEVVIDLAFVTQADPDIRYVTKTGVSFTVQRWGW